VAVGLLGATEAEREARAWALLALLAGGATLARAVPDVAMAEQIANAVQDAASIVARGAPPRNVASHDEGNGQI